MLQHNKIQVVQVRATYSMEDVFRPTRLVLTNKNKYERQVAPR